MTAFTNSTFTSIPDYPSDGSPPVTGLFRAVTVSGYVGGTVTVSVTVTGINHTFPSDLDFALFGPSTSAAYEFWSDAGGGASLANAKIKVADGGGVMPSPGMPGFVSGQTYAPADYFGGDGTETPSNFGLPFGLVHASPTGGNTFASVFGGLNPNGEWRLYVRDDAAGDTGSFSSWTLDVSASFYGDFGDNGLVGGNLTEHLYGYEGNDQLTGGGGADTLDGGYGFDFARYDTSASGVTVHLDGGVNAGDAFGDQFFSIEGLVGSNSGDQLYGDGADNSIYGIGGNDNLYGGAGQDLLDGGDGFDFTRYDFASAGVTARLDGGAGAGDAAGDRFFNIEGLVGSNSGDVLVGDDRANTIYGQGGGDVLYGNGGNDALYGGEGGDVLNGGTAADMLDGGNGYDAASYVYAASGVTARLDGGGNAGEAQGDTYVSIEGLVGSSFNDVLVGSAVVNGINGGEGDDALYGLAGNDVLDGEAGNDILIGGLGSDVLNGGVGNDEFRFNYADLAVGDHDIIKDFGEIGINFDKITFAGFPGTAPGGGPVVTTADTAGGALVTFHISGGTADVLIQNFTSAQLSDQYLFV